MSIVSGIGYLDVPTGKLTNALAYAEE